MNNELLFKAPAVLYPFLSLLFLRALRRGDVKYRALLILYLVFPPSRTCNASWKSGNILHPGEHHAETLANGRRHA